MLVMDYARVVAMGVPSRRPRGPMPSPSSKRVNPIRDVALASQEEKKNAARVLRLQEGYEEYRAAVAAAKTREMLGEWRKTARPDQLPPDRSEWIRTLLMVGGRGSGKTWAASHIFAELIAESPPGEYAIVGPTFGDAVGRSMTNPESGLIAALGGKTSPEGGMLEKGPFIERFVTTKGELHMQNNSVVYCDGGDDGALRIQGTNLRAVWVDEIGNIVRWAVTWDESIRYAVRLEPGLIIATGTPKRQRAARVLIRRLLDDPDVVKRQLRTKDNLDNLSLSARNEFLKAQGTALERQELEGDLITGAENALWDEDTIDLHRMKGLPKDTDGNPTVDIVRLIVAVDPAGSHRPDSDDTGIVVAGLGSDGHGYVFEDLSCKEHPDTWAKRVVMAYKRKQADAIVSERNHGGDMVESVIKAVDPNVYFKSVWASRGKVVRAEPIAAAYKEGRVHHIGPQEHLQDLEQQMCDFTPVPAPGAKDDRVDALVWALTDLGIQGQHVTWDEVYAPVVDDAESQTRESEHNPWMTVYGPDSEEPWANSAPVLTLATQKRSVTQGGLGTEPGETVEDPTAARRPLDLAALMKRQPGSR